jgi:uncharacterized protein
VPGSITQYVLKLHGRCDLACDHCYVYEHADQSWRQKPRAMSTRIAEVAATRIAEHAAAHRLSKIWIVLHGGEPLLLGKRRMRAVLAALSSRITPVTRLDMRIHTNGVLLDEDWCSLFDEYGVTVGISLDGDQAANDRHRRFADGRSSHRYVMDALELLKRPEHRHLYAGILCTIDIDNDPIAVYSALVAQAPPNLDLLLPHATWDNPPYRPDGSADGYAAWLTRIYRRWISDGQPVPIRLFDSLTSAARGGPSSTEAIGLDAVDLLVIDTDGSWEQADSLKTAFDGAPATGLAIYAHSVDEVTASEGVASRLGGLDTLSGTCQACPVVRICGGGLYAHRYRTGTGFDNPSVYCSDLKALIAQVTAEMPSRNVKTEQRETHTIPLASFDAMAAGPGDIETVRSLGQMQLSLTRTLVAEVASADGWRHRDLQQAAVAGWELLCALDAEQPEAVHEVFSHPYIRAWAVRCLDPPRDADPDFDRAHLAGLAAAAALRAGISARLPLPVRLGKLHLPTIGAIEVPDGSRTMEVSISPGREPSTARGGQWQMAQRADGPVLRVTLEDLDPFRDCLDLPGAGRLSRRELRAWQQALNASGSRLTAALPRYASVLSAGLHSVVPLQPDPDSQRAGTARQTFGAVALALPNRTRDLDALLLHEFQHVKLNALLDLYDLFNATDARRLRVPWRPDPRPVEAVLHGAYAHLATVHLLWSGGPMMRELYLEHQSWVSQTSVALLASGCLTAAGERFVQCMHAAAEVPPDEQ